MFISSGTVYCCAGAKWGPQEGHVGGERQTYSGVFPQTRAATHGASHLPGAEPQGRKDLIMCHYSFAQLNIPGRRRSSTRFCSSFTDGVFSGPPRTCPEPLSGPVWTRLCRLHQGTTWCSIVGSLRWNEDKRGFVHVQHPEFVLVSSHLQVHAATYEDLDKHGKYELLYSTRHFGGMVWYLVRARRADGLMVDLLQRERWVSGPKHPRCCSGAVTHSPHLWCSSPRLQDAVSLVSLFHMLHPHSESAQEASRQQAAGTDLLKVRTAPSTERPCRGQR